MKIIIIIISLILIAGLIYFAYLGYKSQTGSAPGLSTPELSTDGLDDAKLSHCPDTPNCICTEYPDDKSHYTDAISYSTVKTENILPLIQDIILKSGGAIITIENHYLAATYTSGIFRYVDDFEVRIDTDNQLIHIRSASRVGKSDFGANLKRIEKFKLLFEEKNKPH